MKELLEHIQNIFSLPEQAKVALAAICTPQQFRKGEHIQQFEHTCRTIYFVQNGIIRIYYLKDGTDITESFEFEHAFVARAESLFSGKPSQKAIQAITDCTLVAIDAHKLFALFDSYPALERLFRKIIEQAYVNTVNRVESLQFHTAEERYHDLLKSNPDVLKRVPLKYIASFLGITQVSLSRIRALK
jgi:CRP-like cAMP-binding protein